jgi:uncharacterized protein (TIGR02996 family)
MTDGDAMLRAIIDAPDDDTPRLVYADLLEENGDADRAEFIRLQVEPARLAPDGDGRAKMEEREHELLARHAVSWLGALHHPLLHWRFDRGFVAGLGHAGVFQLTQAIEYEDANPDWHYHRFYPDGVVLFDTSEETPPDVSQWFFRGPNPTGQPEPDEGEYVLRWTAEAVHLSFGVDGGYGTAYGPVGFDGTLEVAADGSGGVRAVCLLFEVFTHGRQLTERQAYRLVEVQGYDSATGP